MAKGVIADADEFVAEYTGEPLNGIDAILQELDGDKTPLSQSGYPVSQDTGAVKQASNPSNMTATFCIVTRTKDPNRHGNMVQILPGDNGAGLKTQAYAANPVVLFDHGAGLALPIGTSQSGDKLDLQMMKTKAVACCYFSQTLPDAAVIFGLIDENILKMASVQFIPQKAMRLNRQGPDGPPEGGIENWQYLGYDFVESELLEWSVVAIGADPGALRKSIDRGKINGYRIGQALRQGLTAHAERPAVWSPGVTLQATKVAPSEPPVITEILVPQNLSADSPIAVQIREWISDGIAQAFAKHADQSSQCQALDVDSVSANDRIGVKQEAAQPPITGEQLAAAYTAATQKDAVSMALQQLPGLISAEVQKAAQPIVEQQNKLHGRLKQLSGRG